MTDATVQTALSVGVPTLAVLIGILINNSRLGDVTNRIADVNSRINDLRSHMDARFDDMRDMWRGELRRVEEVIDARLKHLEER
ncbi:MAG TPA: hypothetical protein VMB85_06715 [Bryobacteraceae bacterium]|nr:hypothetical protein [Bryobacteraceae bacterium]